MKIREIQPVLEEFIFVAQAHKLGLFDYLAKKPCTAEKFAAARKYDMRAARVLFDALAELGYLVRKKERFGVSGDAMKRLVDRGDRAYEGHFWQFLYYLMDPWRTLPHVLETGRPDRRSYRDFSMDDFIRGMDSPWKKAVAPEVVRLCREACPKAKTVADIGGAPGTLAREFASRGLETVIYDLQVSMKVMKKELAKVPKIRIVEGDATRSFPPGSFDITFLGNLCHGQSPEDNRAIIRRCYEHLNPGGVVAVFDNLKGENRGASVLALHMITQSPHGNVYTRGEYLDWIRSAGFKKTSVKKLTDPAWSLITAIKPG